MALNHPKNRNLHWKSYATVAQKPVKKMGQLESMPFFFPVLFQNLNFNLPEANFLLFCWYSATQKLSSCSAIISYTSSHGSKARLDLKLKIEA